ncbi:MAG: extracellular solute-binding protein [Clostridiaceae bacterium]|nr:extracellular solute-binding protein [Clostridiaceae bacterium]
MKRICSIVLVLLLILTSAACSSKEEADISTIGNADKTPVQTPEAADTKAPVLDMGKEDNTRITIATSMQYNRFLEIAVEKFQNDNPGIIVEINSYTSMGETLTQQTEDGGMLVVSENTDPGGEKYIKTINTELMSGAGPDIIDTYYVPCGKFADNGFLTDMRLIMQQDTSFDISGYYENIMLGNQYKGGLYSIPLGFIVNMLSGKYVLPQETISKGFTWDAFFKTATDLLAAKGVKEPYVLYEGEEDLFRALWNSNYSNFIKEDTKECNFTSGEFVDLIKMIKDAADKRFLYHSVEQAASDKSWENIYFYQSFFDAYLLEAYNNPKEGNFACGIPSSTGDSIISADIFQEYGINNNSKSKGAAWKFLKYLISEEMQSSPELFLFPINKNAMAAKIKRENSDAVQIDRTAYDPVFLKIIVNPDRDWQISEIVAEETMKYFEGQRTAEDTARIIQSRVDIMIKE